MTGSEVQHISIIQPNSILSTIWVTDGGELQGCDDYSNQFRIGEKYECVKCGFRDSSCQADVQFSENTDTVQ